MSRKGDCRRVRGFCGLMLCLGLTSSLNAQPADDVTAWDAFYRGQPTAGLADTNSMHAFAALSLIESGNYREALGITSEWSALDGGCNGSDRYAIGHLVLAKLGYLTGDMGLGGLVDEASRVLSKDCVDDNPDLLVIVGDQFSRLAHLADLPGNFGKRERQMSVKSPLATLLVQLSDAAQPLPAVNDAAPYVRLQVRHAIASAESLFQKGEFRQAAGLVMEARLLLDQVPESSRYQRHHLDGIDAILQRRLGKLEKAYEINKRSYSEVATLYADGHDDQALAANNFGVLQLDRGRYDDALALFRRSLEVTVSTHGELSSDAASTRQNIAGVLLEIGDLDEALVHAEQAYEAVDMQSRRTGEVPRHAGVVNYGLALACRETGDFECAHAALSRARALYVERHGLTHERIAFVDHAQALTHRRQNQHRQSEQFLRNALQIYRQTHPDLKSRNPFLAALELAEVTPDPQERERLWAKVASTARDVPSAEAQWRAYSGWAGQEAEAGYRTSAIFFGKLAVNTVQQLLRGVAFSRRLQTFYFARRRESYDRLFGLLVDAGRLVEAQHIKTLMQADERFEYQGRLRRGSAASAVSFTAVEQQMLDRIVDQSEPVELKEIRRLLEVPTASQPSKGLSELIRPGQASALLNYFVMEDRIEVILSTPGDVDRHRSAPISRTQLRRKVTRLHSSLQAGTSEWRELSKELYAWLIEPVESLLFAERSASEELMHLFVSADDVLRYLPFGILGDDESRLVNRLAIARLAPQAVSEQSVPSRQIAAFATTRAFPPLPALPAARAEVNAIVDTGWFDSGLFSGREYVDDKFTPDRFRQESFGSRLVHIASHFQVAGGNDKDSFLLFGDGQQISLRDLRRQPWDLSAAELAVLSGCSTAVGGALGSGVELDGFAGLLHAKGARQVLATLWPVDDAVTAALMQSFYRRLASGETAIRSLSGAQREFSGRHPADWAAFVLWSPPTPS